MFRLPLWSRFDMDLDEKVADSHFPALVAELTDLTQVTQMSRLKALPKVSATVIEL